MKLTINMAMTIDGQSILPGKVWHGLTSPIDRETMDIIRAKSDAIMAGYAGIENDNPYLADRRYLNQDQKILPIIFSGTGCIDPKKRVFRFPHPKSLIVTSRSGSERISLLNWGQEPPDIYIWEGWHQLRELLNWLCKNRGINNLLLEGGPTINSHFFQNNLVDEMYLTIVPYLSGGGLNGPVGKCSYPTFPKAHLLSSTAIKDEIFLHYKFPK